MMLAFIRLAVAILSFVTGWSLMTILLLATLYLILLPLYSWLPYSLVVETGWYLLATGLTILTLGLFVTGWLPNSVLLRLHFRQYRLARIDRNRGYDALLKIIETQCQIMDIAKCPPLYVLHTTEINAFALGRCLVLTEGILAQIGHLEMEWVISHELSHIKNNDSISGLFWMNIYRSLSCGRALYRLLLIVIFKVFSKIPLLRDWIIFIISPLKVILFLFWIAQSTSRLVFLLLDRLISRSMEYRADVDATKSTSAQSGLSALNILRLGLEPDFWGMFSTHPSTEKRINNIASLATVS